MKINNFWGEEKKKAAKKEDITGNLWQKSEVSLILDMWETNGIKEIANALGRGVGSVQYIVGALRKTGFKLKSKRSYATTSVLIEEALKELKLK